MVCTYTAYLYIYIRNLYHSCALGEVAGCILQRIKAVLEAVVAVFSFLKYSFKIQVELSLGIIAFILLVLKYITWFHSAL